MIDLNMSDVISVLNTCQPYLIAFGIVAALAVIAMIACGKLAKPLVGASVMPTLAPFFVILNIVYLRKRLHDTAAAGAAASHGR